VVTTVLDLGLGVSADGDITAHAAEMVVKMSMVVSLFSFVQVNHPDQCEHGIPSALASLPGFSKVLWLMDPASQATDAAVPSTTVDSASTTSTSSLASTATDTSASTGGSQDPPGVDPALMTMLQTLQTEVARLRDNQTAPLPAAIPASAAPMVVPPVAVPGTVAAAPTPPLPVAIGAFAVFPSSLPTSQKFSSATLHDARNGFFPTLRHLLASAAKPTVSAPTGARGQSIRLGADGGLIVDTSDQSVPVTTLTQLRTVAEQMARLLSAIGRADLSAALREDFVGSTLQTLERVATFATSLAYVRGTFDALGTFIRTSSPGQFSFKFDTQLHAVSNADAIVNQHNMHGRGGDGQPSRQRPRFDAGFTGPRTDAGFIGPPPPGPPPSRPFNPPARAPLRPPAPFQTPNPPPRCANFAHNRPCAFNPCPYLHQ
jgi:hypothetical protein